MKGKIIVSESSGTLSIPAGNQPEIYPNPAADVLYLRSPSSEGPSEVEIYDMTGKVRVSIKDPGARNHITTLEIQDLDQGLYFIKMKYPSGSSYVMKFIKI
jgi:hypothetical protein